MAKKLNILYNFLNDIHNSSPKTRKAKIEKLLNQPTELIDLLLQNKPYFRSNREVLNLDDLVYYSYFYYITRNFCTNLLNSKGERLVLSIQQEKFLDLLLGKLDSSRRFSSNSDDFPVRQGSEYKHPAHLVADFESLKNDYPEFMPIGFNQNRVQSWFNTRKGNGTFERLADYYDLKKAGHYMEKEELSTEANRSNNVSQGILLAGVLLIALIALASTVPLTLAFHKLIILTSYVKVSTLTSFGVISNYIDAAIAAVGIGVVTGGYGIKYFSSFMERKIEGEKEYERYRKETLAKLIEDERVIDREEVSESIDNQPQKTNTAKPSPFFTKPRMETKYWRDNKEIGTTSYSN